MAFPTGWNYKRSVAIDSGQKSGSPTGIVLTITHDSGLADANGPLDADGSAPSQNGGGDIRCSSDAAGSTQIPVDVVSWVTDNDHASATCEIKVNFDDLSSDTLYLWWGTAGTESQPAVTDTYGRNAVYSSGGHIAVYTLDEDPSGSAPQFIDRTGNGNGGTSNGSMTSGDVVAGQLGDGIDFDGIDDYIDCGDINASEGISALTVSCWAALTNPTSIDHELITKDDGSNRSWSFAQLGFTASAADKLRWLVRTSSTQSIDTTSIVWNDSNFHRAVGLYDGSNIYIRFDGASASSTKSQTGNINSTSESVLIGRRGDGFGDLDGIVDEVRIYARAITADDDTTLYNCESDNATFWAVGSVVANTPTVLARQISPSFLLFV